MIYVVSDLHGFSLDMFKSYLSSIRFGENDWLYILGDVIDRGDDGVRYLQWLLEQCNVQLLLGNHEAMLLACSFIFDTVDEVADNLTAEQMKKLSAWMANGAEPTIKALKALKEKSPEQIDFILEYLREECPTYEVVSAGGRDFILTHSGLGNFSPDKKLSEYKKTELLWSRPAVTDRYFKNMTVIFGHTPTVFYGKEYDGRAFRTDTWIDIDAGCAGGRKPVILRLDDMKEFRF